MSSLLRLPAAVLLLAVALTLVAVGSASAEGATVDLRVEGATATLVAAQITTGAGAYDKAGTPCSGTSAGGALEQATGGAWSGPVQPGTGQTVHTILGETHPGTAGAKRFVLSVNSVPTEVSPCALELNTGDRVLFFVADAVPARTCLTNGRDGLCGTPDRTAPPASITSIREQQRFTRRTAPRLLRGIVGSDPAGLLDVRLRLTRTISTSRCSYFSGIEDSFQRAKACGAVGPRFFSIGRSANWSFELPARLTRGRYTLDVEATDTLGNFTTAYKRGRDRIVFTVAG